MRFEPPSPWRFYGDWRGGSCVRRDKSSRSRGLGKLSWDEWLASAAGFSGHAHTVPTRVLTRVRRRRALDIRPSFVMPAPKEGAPPPTWVTASPAADGPSGARPKMTMITQAKDGEPLTLTELLTEKGAVKGADFPPGTHVTVTYRESDGKKWLQKIERAVAK